MTMRHFYGAGPGDIATYDTRPAALRVLVEGLFPSRRVELRLHPRRPHDLWAAPARRDAADLRRRRRIGTEHSSCRRARWASPISAARVRSPSTARTARLENRDVLYVGRGGRKSRLPATIPQARHGST